MGQSSSAPIEEQEYKEFIEKNEVKKVSSTYFLFLLFVKKTV